MKVLLTCSGTLISRGILDALSGRDGGLEIIGANLYPQDATALRCSRGYELPPDSDPVAVAAALLKIVASEQPDLVIPCRDSQLPIVAGLQEQHPNIVRAPIGPLGLTTIMVDKWEAFQWCQKHGIPFTPTVLSGHSPGAALGALVEEFGFPLIAKPRDGSGSLGVRVVHNWDQATRSLTTPGTLIQPFLDPPEQALVSLDTSLGSPLFWEVPVPRNYGGQFLIGPDGELGPSMQMIATQRLGRNEYSSPWHDESLQKMMEAAVAAVKDAGWRGPINVQARPHKGRWYITEFGGRFSGGTSQRTWLGFDEVGWIINRWASREVVPPLGSPPASEVRRYLADCPVWETPHGPSLVPLPPQ